MMNSKSSIPHKGKTIDNLKPVLGYRDLLLFYLVAIFGIRLLPNAASARLPFVVGLDRFLPPSFGNMLKKYKIPYVSLIALVKVTIFFIILSSLGEKLKIQLIPLVSIELFGWKERLPDFNRFREFHYLPFLRWVKSCIKFSIGK